MIELFSRWVTPNQLTLSRVVSIPVIFFLLAFGSESRLVMLITAILFFFACLTDYFDGALARYKGLTSDFGKLVDPIADKIMISSILVVLVSLERAPSMLAALIIAREFAVSGLRSTAVVKGIVISASTGGKIKTISQMLALGFLITHYPLFGLPAHEVGIALLWIAMLITVWTGVKYFISYYESVPSSFDT